MVIDDFAEGAAESTRWIAVISTERIWVILQEAGYRWQKSRSWCETGQAARKRKRGVVTVFDPDATPKKN